MPVDNGDVATADVSLPGAVVYFLGDLRPRQRMIFTGSELIQPREKAIKAMPLQNIHVIFNQELERCCIEEFIHKVLSAYSLVVKCQKQFRYFLQRFFSSVSTLLASTSK